MAEQSDFQRIVDLIDVIHRKPKKCVKYFFIDDDNRSIIVDGMKLKMLPQEFFHLYKKDEFYVHINPKNKKIMYYAYNIENMLDGTHVDELEGFMEWEQIESCIYNFLVLHIKDLSDAIAPLVDARENRDVARGAISSVRSPIPGPAYQANWAGGTSTSSSYYNTPFGYGTSAYKDREAFYDRLWLLLKGNKSVKAIDHIHSYIQKMCEDKKFDELDHLIKVIAFEKLNVISMVGILDATKNYSQDLKERNDFFGKVKVYLNKIKPSRAGKILHAFDVNTTQT